MEQPRGGEILFHNSINKSIIFLFSGFLLFALHAISAPVDAIREKCEIWPDWNNFKKTFISDEGRVVDHSVAQGITTSEGQSYALMFALIANDRVSFDQILRWTENNLAYGDLTANLPAWKWGKRTDDSWGVIDDNAASDADLWIAYVLNEAGQQWKIPRYTALSELLASRILREETTFIPDLGLVLLPGPKGFQLSDTAWRLNPSYMPIQIFRRFATIYPKSDWQKLIESSIAVITESAPHGFVPEWVDYHVGKGFQADIDPALMGVGFNAIRVYLWAGMLDKHDAVHRTLLKHLVPMGSYVGNNGTPGENTSAGFSSALLPFLKAVSMSNSLHLQRKRIIALAPLKRTDNYYDQVLTLFGLGWLEGRYKFDRNGQFIPRWKCEQH